ncbi:MAG: fibronectin type III domain-containing protein [Marinobacter sp.]|uniref:fibronectin type III domain-containing protein n=1 Tax=Marinobacter sp. TaxID=50741 RepID=UPI0034A051A0
MTTLLRTGLTLFLAGTCSFSYSSASAQQPQPGTSLNSVDLSWTAPLTRMDGSSIALSEIHHYEIRYGMSAKDLSKLQKVDSDETRYRFKSLRQGRWHFSIVVVDDNGLKSPPSGLVTKKLN